MQKNLFLTLKNDECVDESIANLLYLTRSNHYASEIEVVLSNFDIQKFFIKIVNLNAC